VGNSKLTIAIVVVVLLLGGFLAHRHFKGQNEGAEHAKKTLEVVLQSARSSDRAGLNHMAGAIKAYYKDNRFYPANLQALYPKYVPLKAFIDELNWDYKSSADGFELGKSVDVRGRTMVASIDQNMKISSAEGTRVAARPVPAQGGGVAAPTLTLAQVLKPLETLPRPDLSPAAGGTAPEIVRSEPRTVEADAILDPLGLAGRTSKDLLVWRQDDGSLGFGNVQYPKARQLYIATADHWYRMEQRPVAVPEAIPTREQRPVNAADTVAGLTRGNQYIAWKDKNGVIGFGNVQYPGADVADVSINGRWEKLAN